MILKGNFKVKENSKTKSVEVEGLANATTKDRIGDLIPKDAWLLDEFKKNPVIFFNHEPKDIIGKATAVEATDEGLKIRVRLSNSKEGVVPYVRDLVQEGILKAFSVGFNDHGSSEKDNDGTNVIKQAELLETSIVSIPMNQDSLFTVVGGEAKDHGMTYTRKAVDKFDFAGMDYEQMKEAVLSQKGAHVAAAIHNALSKSDTKLELSDSEKEIMVGEILPVPEEFMVKAAEALGLDIASLKELNEPEDEEKEKAEEPDSEDDNEKAPDADMDDEEDKEKAEEPDSTDDDDDKDDGKDEKSQGEKDFQECVNGKVPKLLEEGMERDQAVAQAIAMCEKENKCSATSEMIKDAILAQNEKQAVAGSEPSGVKEEFEQGQPSIILQKSQLALTGSMVELQKETLAELRKIADALTAKVPEESETEEVEETAPEPEDEEEKGSLVGNPEDEDDKEKAEDDEDDEEAKEKMLQITKDLEEIAVSQKKLNKLLSS